jgi:type VI secretion system protein ImpG
VFPAYLRPVPSCSIAQFDVASLFESRTQALTVPRGTEFEHRPSLCQFTTAYDVTLAPIAITRAGFSSPTAAPPLGEGLLAPDTVGIISIGFISSGRKFASGNALLPDTLRLYLHADDGRLAAALINAILLRPQTAFVEADRHWRSLGKPAVSAVGFADTEALVEESKHVPSHPALRLLTEYAAFPHKFRFVNLDFAAMLRAAGPCNRLTLHLPVAGSAADTQAVQRLDQLTGHHVRLFCTPVVNAFRTDAKPVGIKADMKVFPVVPPKGKAALSAIHSIDLVRMMHGEGGAMAGAEVPPHRAPRHWSPRSLLATGARQMGRGGGDRMRYGNHAGRSRRTSSDPRRHESRDCTDLYEWRFAAYDRHRRSKG